MCQMHFPLTLSCDGEATTVAKPLMSHCQENLLAFNSILPVPQTDTGRWDEYSKANGRRVVKELGKLAP